MRLDGTKATPVGNISARMLKSTIDTHVSILTKIVNLCLRNSCFPDHFKAAEVSPTFMKNDDLGRENYRPASFLPHMSKVFARAMYVQIKSFLEESLSKKLTGFRKNHSTRHCLINILEQCKYEKTYKGGFACANDNRLIKDL